jgi:hypothetical protein
MARLIPREPDTPLAGRRRAKSDTEWHSLLAKAMKHPGRWWEVDPPYPNPRMAANAAYDINVGRNQAIPEGQWEATSRSRLLGDGNVVGILSVRFLGD